MPDIVTPAPLNRTELSEVLLAPHPTVVRPNIRIEVHTKPPNPQDPTPKPQPMDPKPQTQMQVDGLIEAETAGLSMGYPTVDVKVVYESAGASSDTEAFAAGAVATVRGPQPPHHTPQTLDLNDALFAHPPVPATITLETLSFQDF